MYIIDEDTALTVRLPWPPTVNNYWGQRVVGKRVMKFIGAKGKQFRYLVNEIMKEHKEHCVKHFHHDDTRLALHVVVRPPDRRKRDIDNLCKALQDALDTAGAYIDDEQIDDLHLVRDKEDIVKGGEIIITLGVIKGKAYAN